MTIAELLVQTTAMLEASVLAVTAIKRPTDSKFCVDGLKWAQVEAMLIVSRAYGPPCGKFYVDNTLEQIEPGDGAQCLKCRWPKSSHKADE